VLFGKSVFFGVLFFGKSVFFLPKNIGKSVFLGVIFKEKVLNICYSERYNCLFAQLLCDVF
jgi:hypothetical protein